MFSVRRLVRRLAALCTAAVGFLVPLSASPAEAAVGVACWSDGQFGNWPQFPLGSVFVISVSDLGRCSIPEPTTGIKGVTYITPSDLTEGQPVCWRWNRRLSGGDPPLPASLVYLDGFTTSTACASTISTTDQGNTRTVACPDCPHTARVVNDASKGRSHFDNSFHNGFALNSLTDIFGSKLATQTASVPAGSGCTQTLGDRKVKVTSFNGSTSRWACMTQASPTFMQFYVDATPATFQMHKDNPAKINIFDGAERDLNLGGTHGVNMPLRAISPALFSSDGSGSGAPSGSVRRVRADGSVTTEPLVNGQTITLKGDQVYLVLRATGIRYHNPNEALDLHIGGLSYRLTGGTPHSFGPSSEAGVDEVRIRLDGDLKLANQPVWLQSASGADTTDYGRESNDLNLSLDVRKGGLANLAVNGGFNLGFGSWQVMPLTNIAIYGPGQTGNDPYEGSGFLATNTSDGNGGVFQDVPVVINAGDTFCASAQVASQGTGGGAGATFAVWLLGGGGNEASNKSVRDLPGGNGWTPVQTCVTATTAHTVIRIQFYVLPNAGTLIVDNVDVH